MYTKQQLEEIAKHYGLDDDTFVNINGYLNLINSGRSDINKFMKACEKGKRQMEYAEMTDKIYNIGYNDAARGVKPNLDLKLIRDYKGGAAIRRLRNSYMAGYSMRKDDMSGKYNNGR